MSLECLPNELLVEIADNLNPSEAMKFSFCFKYLYHLLRETYFRKRARLPLAHYNFFVPPSFLFKPEEEFVLEKCAKFDNFQEIVLSIAWAENNLKI